nr:hypothetical protein [Tanacetum cinerariifolium]
EVILNGDSLAPTRVIEGVLQPVAPTTVEQRLTRKNELKPTYSMEDSYPYLEEQDYFRGTKS